MGADARSHEIDGDLGLRGFWCWSKGRLWRTGVEGAGGAHPIVECAAPWSWVWALVWVGSPLKVKSYRGLQIGDTHASTPRRTGVREEKGVTGADLVALRSSRALWDRNLHIPAHGDGRFRRFKLHSPALGPGGLA